MYNNYTYIYRVLEQVAIIWNIFPFSTKITLLLTHLEPVVLPLTTTWKDKSSKLQIVSFLPRFSTVAYSVNYK